MMFHYLGEDAQEKQKTSLPSPCGSEKAILT